MSLAQLIKDIPAALTAAQAADFDTVASVLSVPTVTQRRATLVSMAETLTAIGAASDATILAFEASPTGRHGLAKLAAEGLDYGHPITQALLAGMVSAGAITQQIADTLTALSVQIISPAAAAGVDPPTAEDCEKAWIVSQCESTIKAIADPIAAKRTAINAWLDALDTSAMTPSEVAAYCADLLNSPDGNPTGV